MARRPRDLRLHHQHVQIRDLARITGLSYATIWRRVNAGWSPERIIQTPKIAVQDRYRCWTSTPKASLYGFLAKDDTIDLFNRRLLFERAKRGEAAAIAELRRMGLLTWQTAERGVIV